MAPTVSISLGSTAAAPSDANIDSKIADFFAAGNTVSFGGSCTIDALVMQVVRAATTDHDRAAVLASFTRPLTIKYETVMRVLSGLVANESSARHKDFRLLTSKVSEIVAAELPPKIDLVVEPSLVGVTLAPRTQASLKENAAGSYLARTLRLLPPGALKLPPPTEKSPEIWAHLAAGWAMAGGFELSVCSNLSNLLLELNPRLNEGVAQTIAHRLKGALIDVYTKLDTNQLPLLRTAFIQSPQAFGADPGAWLEQTLSANVQTLGDAFFTKLRAAKDPSEVLAKLAVSGPDYFYKMPEGMQLSLARRVFAADPPIGSAAEFLAASIALLPLEDATASQQLGALASQSPELAGQLLAHSGDVLHTAPLERIVGLFAKHPELVQLIANLPPSAKASLTELIMSGRKDDGKKPKEKLIHLFAQHPELITTLAGLPAQTRADIVNVATQSGAGDSPQGKEAIDLIEKVAAIIQKNPALLQILTGIPVEARESMLNGFLQNGGAAGGGGDNPLGALLKILGQ